MMSREPRPLTTTSFTLLGLLAIKPWTTYELAGQMDRSLGRFWPRARSKLFEEPRKLVAHGLAKASKGSVGLRARTVYDITPKGRRALAAWLATPTEGGPTLEFEALAKVFFAEHGTKQDLLATLASLQAWGEQRRLHHRSMARAFLDGQTEFQQRGPILALTGRFLGDFDALVERWAAWASEQVEGWPDDILTAQPDRETWERFVRAETTSEVERPA